MIEQNSKNVLVHDSEGQCLEPQLFANAQEGHPVPGSSLEQTSAYFLKVTSSLLEGRSLRFFSFEFFVDCLCLLVQHHERLYHQVEANYENLLNKAIDNHANALSQAKVLQEELQTQCKELQERLSALLLENKKMQERVKFLVAREAQRKLEEEVENRKIKRKNAKKLPMRDVLSYEDLLEMLRVASATYKSPLPRARVILAMILSYFSGLRISNHQVAA